MALMCGNWLLALILLFIGSAIYTISDLAISIIDLVKVKG